MGRRSIVQNSIAQQSTGASQATSTPPLTGRLDGLQLGRGLAALTVVIGHAVGHPLQEQASELWQLASRYGVTLFFVISGFIMVQTTGQDRFDPKAFISRRIRRVVPIYWFVTLLVAVTVLIAPMLYRNTVFDVRHLVASLLFIPMYDPAQPDSISPLVRLGWTLNFEMFFYVIFTVTFAMSVLGRAIALSAFFSACVILGHLVHFDAAIPAFYTRIDTLGFVAGVWLGVFNLRGLLRFNGRTLAVCFLGSVVILGYIAADYAVLRPVPVTQLWLILVCAFHAALLLILVDKRGLRTPKSLLYVGDASYSMYLFHMFAIGAATAVILRLPPVWTIPGICVSAAAGIATGFIAYRFIEQPLNAVMRGKRPLTAAQIEEGAVSASTKGARKPADPGMSGPRH